MRHLRIGVAASLLLFIGIGRVYAESPAKTATFNHRTTANGHGVRLTLASGEAFQVIVEETETTDFDYEVSGITLEPTGPAARASTDSRWTTDKVHDAAFGGYIVRVTLKSGKTSKLPSPVQWYVIVTETGWDASFAGGFVVSKLTDPEFEGIKGADDVLTIQRAKSKEDDARLAVAAFIHVRYTGIPYWTVLSFGIGIKESSRTDYYIGSGLRLGDKAIVTLGVNWGPIKRLPAGLSVGDRISDVNTLSTLPTRNVARGFLSLSYSFVSVADFIKKPFAPTAGK